MSQAALRLYREFLREARRFSNYNFREYIKRRVRFGFEQNRGVSDRTVLDNLLFGAHKDLELVRRQATISNMYKSESLVIEAKGPSL